MPVGNAVKYSASITPNEQIDLAFKSGGYVGSIMQVRGADGRMRSLDLGDYVKAGTVLASVRSAEYQDRIAQAEADLAKAQAAHEQSKLSFERTSALFVADAIEHNFHDVNKLLPTYAVLSRMRVTSSTDVLASAERVIDHIISTYSQPNLTPEQIRSKAATHDDPLHEFSNICRCEPESLWKGL
jgi:multidrug efflux pump subunit AcrA (membrane-fusion protein)